MNEFDEMQVIHLSRELISKHYERRDEAKSEVPKK